MPGLERADRGLLGVGQGFTGLRQGLEDSHDGLRGMEDCLTSVRGGVEAVGETLEGAWHSSTDAREGYLLTCVEEPFSGSGASQGSDDPQIMSAKVG